MAADLRAPCPLLAVGLLLSCLVPAVEAYDAGDAIALLLGAVLTGVGLCACLGWYTRNRDIQL